MGMIERHRLGSLIGRLLCATLLGAALYGCAYYQSLTEKPDFDTGHYKSVTPNGWTVYESTRESRRRSAASLVDDSRGGPWISESMPFYPEWVVLVPPRPMALGEFSFTGQPGRLNAMPGKFSLEVEQRGRWQEVLRSDNSCGRTSQPASSWRFEQPVQANRFRWVIYSSCGDNRNFIVQDLAIDPWRPSATLTGPLFINEWERVYPASETSVTSSASLPNLGIELATDGNPGSFWHVDPGKPGVASLTFDLGDQSRAVNYIRFKPRGDDPTQFFKKSILQGGRDGVTWQDIAEMRLEEVPSADWMTWKIPNDVDYRFYRLLFPSGFAAGRFMSIAEMEVYAATRAVPAVIVTASRTPRIDGGILAGSGTGAQLSANTFLDNSMGPDNLVDGKPGSFWHVAVGERAVPQPAVVVDLQDRHLLTGVKLRPRLDEFGQFLSEAWLEGANSPGQWNKIAILRTIEEPRTDEWVGWELSHQDRPYRYYRLRFTGGYSQGRFLSASELQLLGPGGIPQPVVLPKTRPSEPGSVGQGRIVVDARHNAAVTANSVLNDSFSPANVLDGNAGTFWHVNLDSGETNVPALTIDLGEGRAAALSGVDLLPRGDNFSHFMKEGELAGSNDGRDWAPIAALNHPLPPSTADWISWRFSPPTTKYRYWQLRFPEGHAGGRFVALAELRLLR